MKKVRSPVDLVLGRFRVACLLTITIVYNSNQTLILALSTDGRTEKVAIIGLEICASHSRKCLKNKSNDKVV